MTEHTSSLVRLDAFENDNWSSNGNPVAILNMDSTLHDRIAYCCGMANHLHVLTDLLAQHENIEIRQLAALFDGHLIPLETLLKKMGDDTQPNSESC